MFKTIFPPLRRMGDYMPSSKKISWNNHKIRIFPSESDTRSIIRLLPYFWDSEIVCDLVIKPPKKPLEDTKWLYQWELVDLDDNIIKAGEDIIDLIAKDIRKHDEARKKRGIILGYLHPNKHYRLFLTTQDANGNSSEKNLAYTFTIKDRDEYYMQILILMIAITFAFLKLRG